MQEETLMTRSFSARRAFSVACGVALVLMCAAPGQALTFDLDYDAYPHETPSWDPYGTHLTVLMQAAATVWGGIIRDNHDIRIQYQYEELDGAAASTVWHTSAKHYFDTNNNGVNDSSVERVTNCTIRVDPTIAWFVDPTPLDHSEFTNATQLLSRDLTPDQRADAYAGSPPDLLEAAFFMEPITGPGAPVGRDLFTTVLHEFGHALGFNESSNDSESPYRLASDKVWEASVFAHCERGHDDQNRNHIDTHRALMSYNRLNANRTLPSATDVMVMAEFCRWTQIDMPRKDFVQVGATAYWDHPQNWTGNRRPDAEDDVFIRSGADCILHQPGEARSLLIDEDSRLTITGNQVLRVADLDVGSTGVLEIAWSGSRVEIVDPTTGAALAEPNLWINGSLELTQQANQSFGRLTIQDAEPAAGPTPHLYMDDHSTLTLANNLRLLGGTESRLSRSDILFTLASGSLLELNGPMTLEDESHVSVHQLFMAETAEVSPQLAVLSGSTFTITDDTATAETAIPASGSVEVRDAGSRLTVAGDVRADGALIINAADAYLGGLTVEDSGSLSLRHRGLLDASDANVLLQDGSDITISDLGTCLLADRLVLNTSVEILGGARLGTGTTVVQTLFGTVAPITLRLDGVGEVLTTQDLIFRSGVSHAAGAIQNSGVVTIHDELQADIGGDAFYTLQDGELHISRLSLLDSSGLEFNLNGGSLHLGEVQRAATASLTLNLNGTDVAVTSASPLALDVVRVASEAALDVDQEMPDHEISMRSLSVGHAGSGRLTLRGETRIDETMVVGDQSTSYGEFTFAPISEWTTFDAGQIQIGRDGRGVFVQTNGFVRVDDADPLQIGRGTYRLEGGRLQTQTAEIGMLAGREGAFLLQGGRHEVGDLRIGMGGASALYQIDSGMLDAHDVFVAAGHVGQLVQNGGSAEIDGDLVLGVTHAQPGTVELNAGRMTVAGRLQIARGDSGRGTFTHQGGDLTVREDLVVGHGEDSIARFDGYHSLDVLGDVLVGAGHDAQANFRIEGSPGAYPTLDVGGSIQVAGGAGSRADMYIIGSGFSGPTVWLTDGDVQVGAGGAGTLHMAGGRIRAIARPGGGYDSQLVLHSSGNLRGYGQVDIPIANNGGVFNSTAIPLAFMSKVSGNGLYYTGRDVNTFQSGRIEFWGGGEIHGAILSDGTVSVLGSADAIQVYGDINGAGEFEVVGVADMYGNMQVANAHVRGTLTQWAGAAKPGLLHLSMGTYNMHGGTLETTSPVVTGTLEQSGGSILIHEDLRIGHDPMGYSVMGDSLVMLSDGILRVTGDLHVGSESEYGMPGWGTLKFTSEKPDLTVEGDLYLTAFGRIEAVENASITLTGSSVHNTSLDHASMAGLERLSLRFQADGSVLDTFEVAGDPDGALTDNFALGRLHLGMKTRLQLVDLTDNGNRPPGGHEALFLHDLFIADTASLDTNGLGLCIEHDVLATLGAWIEDSRLFDSSGLVLESHYDASRNLTWVQPVPEPTTAALLSCALVLLGRRRFRR
jgi:hypothetical protein